VELASSQTTRDGWCDAPFYVAERSAVFFGFGVWMQTAEPTSSEGFSGTLVIGLMIGFGVCLVLVAAALAALSRQRRQIATLMARLDAVEVAVEEDDAGQPETRSQRCQLVSPDDVLHGRTSYVRAMIEGSDSSARSLADRTILAIHSRLEETITPRQLGDDLNVSLRTLERVLAATLECTPRQLILTMKMREARRLLLTGDLRVTEVAYRLGFSSSAHFSTRFRSFYRCAPSSYLRAGTVPRNHVGEGDSSHAAETTDDA
jgi:AraC-like DNA-binding protein